MAAIKREHLEVFIKDPLRRIFGCGEQIWVAAVDLATMATPPSRRL